MLPTARVRVEGRSHFLGSGNLYEAQLLLFSTLADPYQQQPLPPRDLVRVTIAVIVWLSGQLGCLIKGCPTQATHYQTTFVHVI